MKQIQKRLALIGCIAIATSSLSVAVVAREQRVPVQTPWTIDLNALEDDWDGKNVTGVQDITSDTATKLAQSLVGEGIEVKQAKMIGSPRAFGQFTNGGTEVGFDEGLVLSTGRVHTIFESGYQTFNSYENLWDLPASGTEYGFTDDRFNDIAILEFEIVPKTDTLSFQYVLASEEYPEYVASPEFYDEFILLVNGTNYARVPGSDQEVSIGTVSHLQNSAYYRGITTGSMIEVTTPSQIYIGEPISTDAFVYNGATKVFSVDVKVTPNEPTTIRLGIGDKGDRIYDSSVFIKAKSIIDKPATPGKLSLAGKDGQTIFVTRDEGVDGYVAAEWTAYGHAPIVDGVSTYVANLEVLGSGKVEFNDGVSTGQFQVPTGTQKVVLDNMIGGAEPGAKVVAYMDELPDQGAVKVPGIGGYYSTDKIMLTIATNGNAPGMEYMIQRADNPYMTSNKKTIQDWSTQLEYMDADVIPGKTYYYQVKVRDANGFESAWCAAQGISATNSGGGGGPNEGGSSTYTAQPTFKDRVLLMSKNEQKKLAAQILEHMPYTVTAQERETYLKAAIRISTLDFHNQNVLLAEPKLISEVGFDLYEVFDLKGQTVPNFTDLGSSHWAKGSIDQLVAAGIVTDYEEDTFRPNQPMSYEEAFVYLDRVVQNHSVTTMRNTRSQVEQYVKEPEHNTFYSVASIGSKIQLETLGAIEDFEAGITREGLAQIIYELTGGKLAPKAEFGVYVDLDQTTHQEALIYCVEAGLLEGMPDGSLAPQKQLTRAQMMIILTRLQAALEAQQ